MRIFADRPRLPDQQERLALEKYDLSWSGLVYHCEGQQF
jgi:hypothetical protein